MFSDAVVRVVQILLRRDVRGAWTLYRFLAKRLRVFQRAKVWAYSSEPILLDVSRRHTWAFSKTSEELRNREAELAVAIRCLVTAGHVVYDIGANVGLCSDLLRTCVGDYGRVEAFEPNPNLVPALQETFSTDLRVRVHAVALAETDGELPFYIPSDDSMGSLGNWSKHNNIVSVVNVRVVSLDSLISASGLARPTFIKVDVEGAEARVFRGASMLLDRRDAPIIWFEHLHSAAEAQGLDPLAAIHTLKSYRTARYMFWTTDKLLKLEQFEVPPRRWCDVIAVPEARLADLDRVQRALASS